MKFVKLQPEHWGWISEQAAPILCQDTKGIVAEDDLGQILAAAVFDSWSYNACHIHIALKSPFVIRRGFFDEIGNYVFNTSGRKQLIGVTPSNNPKALKFNAHMGMKELFRLPDAYADGVDLVVTRLLKEDWKGTPCRLT